MVENQNESNSKLDYKTTDRGSAEHTNINSETESLSPETIKCKKILELDQSIRYAGICSANGTLMASEYKKSITPLLNGTELEFSAINSVVKSIERELLVGRKLGKINYSVSSYDNVKRATFPLGDGRCLLVSFELNAIDNLIVNKVLKEMNLR